MGSKESVYYLNPEEIKKIISSAPNFRDRVIIEVFAYTGMRRAELRDLKVEDVNFEREEIFIRSGKGGKSRTVPVDKGRVLIDIKQLISNRNKGNIFTSPKSYPQGLSLKQINEIVAKCAKRAGVTHPNPSRKRVNPHLFRHSFVRNALKAGVPLQYVQQIVGHSSIKTTIDVYGTPSQQDIKEMYQEKISNMY